MMLAGDFAPSEDIMRAVRDESKMADWRGLAVVHLRPSKTPLPFDNLILV